VKFNKKKFVFAALTIPLVIGILEVVLNILAATSTRLGRQLLPFRIDAIVPDDRLGHRLNPKYPGHDSKGFKNPAVPDKAQIIALGDSQTYPTAIEPDQAWPRRLESMTKETVYSFAVGGYGPVHSLILWPEAVALHPEIIIEAFYSGNDLYDSFNIVYNRGQLPELKSPDAQLQKNVREAEELESIEMRFNRMYLMGGENTRYAKKPPSTATRIWLSLKRFLSEHSMIYGLFWKARYIVADMIYNDPWENAKAFANSHAEYCQVFSTGQFKTIFTTEYHLLGLNLEDPRIAEGHQISLRAIRRMAELAAERKIRFIVALIPTKELVFKELWSTPSESFRTLTDNEGRFLEITKHFFEENGIEYVDVLPALRTQLAEGIQPYHVSSDGHINEHGHLAIAKLMHAQIQMEHKVE
jgi:hypothetical protein